MISVAQAVEGAQALFVGIFGSRDYQYLGFGPTDTERSGEIIGKAGKCRCNRDGVESIGTLFTSARTGAIKQITE